MATIITNQATLNYRFGNVSASTVSNVTSAVLGGTFEIGKTALNSSYRVGQNVTYIITIKNTGTQLDNISVTDNLGGYDFNGSTLMPLDFVGPAQLFINGNLTGTLTPVESENGVTFDITSIPANGIAQIIYQAKPNSFAGPCCGDEILNVATADCNCPCDVPIVAENILAAECYADVRIAKSVCPNPIVCGEDITYVFDITNYGNIDATDVVFSDTFTPPLTDMTVTLDGVVLPAENYSYVDGALTIPAAESTLELTVPAGTCTQNPTTGEITLTPGKIQIVVTGTI